MKSLKFFHGVVINVVVVNVDVVNVVVINVDVVNVDVVNVVVINVDVVNDVVNVVVINVDVVNVDVVNVVVVVNIHLFFIFIFVKTPFMLLRPFRSIVHIFTAGNFEVIVVYIFQFKLIRK